MTDYLLSKEYIQYLTTICGVKGYDFTDETNPRLAQDNKVFQKYTQWLNLNSSDKVLEVGCGLGRLIKEMYDHTVCAYVGLDVFPEMIEAAEERIGDIAALLVSTVEEIRTTLASQTFSKIVCWGVFDLTQQNIALRNMLEKLDLNGRMLLRGKNDYYHPEDEDAVIAEEKCKEKGISNHFTNYDSLCSLIESLGGKVVEESFFEWRGDGVKDQGQAVRPERFYEYTICIEKVKKVDYSEWKDEKLPIIAKRDSRVFLESITSRELA